MAWIELHKDYITLNGYKIFVDEELRKPLLTSNNGTILSSSAGETCINISDDRLNEYPSLKQFCALQNMSGLVGAIGLPDIHEGYAFPIGSVAAVDLSRSDASISPEGVGFDINCGVRCLISNLRKEDIAGIIDELADELFAAVPGGTGVGQTEAPLSMAELNAILDRGLNGAAGKLFQITQQDITNTESGGYLPGSSSVVYQQAKSRGLKQMGTLGSGNHYLEVQVVDEIFNSAAAETLGLFSGQIIISIHTGSRGLGHVTCSKFIEEVKKEVKNVKEYGKIKNSEEVNEKLWMESLIDDLPSPLCIPYHSRLGQKYLLLMNSAANYAWANRAFIAQKARNVFRKYLPASKFELLCDVSHNIAKIEKCRVDREDKELLVHRKGASRVLPPGNVDIPVQYEAIGQPIFVGGSMGTCSYILLGAEGASSTFFSTCHGAGRLLQRSAAKEMLTFETVVADLEANGIVFRCESRNGIIEEAGECYKDVTRVVEHSANVGITTTVAKVRPVIVIKG
ncbi:tRNA-splicing ligase RtcB (3'-phosphate/5'-hydroxy nucleic acid ligase) [Pancytospora epiphaga]|nr:tRNA-splicing ligase RtcB (3'-phosphate/5'-hydroxy nucleic acid ligase) [Pancytospora epiphaga]